jgi:putative membrane protein
LKRTTIILALAGVALGIGLIVWLGAGKVVRAVASVGWSGFAMLLCWQLMLFAVLGAAWRIVAPGAKLRVTVWGRLVREGGTNVLPFSEVGGLAFGARAVTLAGMQWPLAIASSIADVTAEFLGEIPFVIFGFAMLMARDPHSSLTLPLAIGLVLIAAGAGALFWAERHSAALFHKLGRRIAARWLHKAADRADEVAAEFDRLFSQPRRIALAAGVHGLAWIGGGFTVWLAYHLQGGEIGVIPAMAIEGLLSAALAVAFLVPGGLGVQEVAYVAIGHLFGMPADLSLGLSLLRRARDIAIGIPALASWQIAEARGLSRGEHGRRAPGLPPG